MSKQIGIYLPKNIFSEIDAILPFLVELHARDIELETIFFERSGYKEFLSSPLHQRVLQRVSKITKGFGAHPGIRIFRLLLFALTVVRYRLKGRRITFFYNNSKRGKSLVSDLHHQLVRQIISIGGGHHYVFPPIQAPFTTLFLRREDPKIIGMRAALEGIKVPVQHKPTAAIAYTEIHRKGLQDLRGWNCPIEVIGLPRLYQSWRNIIKVEALTDVVSTLKQLGLPPDTQSFITMLLTAPEFVWFRPDHGFFDLVAEAIDAVQNIFPDHPILLKAKPRYDTGAFIGKGKIKFGQNVHLCTASLAALASRTRVAISIHETSGVFDFLTQGVPVIEYADYAPAWTELFPIPSPWTGLPGFVVAESKNALISALKDIQHHKILADPERLATAIDHKINIDFMGSVKC